MAPAEQIPFDPEPRGPDGPDAVDRSHVQVLHKAVELLAALSESPAGLPLAELAREVGMNRSTVSRILATLAEQKLVMRDDHRRYRLGLRLFELGSSVKEHHLAFHGAATAHLRRIAESYGLTAFLAIRDRDRALFVEQAVYGDRQYVAYPVGSSLPLNVGAAPQVLLAHASDEDVDRLVRTATDRLTAMSVTDPDRLWAKVRAIRHSGIATSDSDITLGLGAIGAPVRNVRGTVIAAVSLAGLAPRLFGPEQQQITAAVREMATAVSQELGWQGEQGTS